VKKRKRKITKIKQTDFQPQSMSFPGQNFNNVGYFWPMMPGYPGMPMYPYA
jgi:hypothetical protein